MTIITVLKISSSLVTLSFAISRDINGFPCFQTILSSDSSSQISVVISATTSEKLRLGYNSWKCYCYFYPGKHIKRRNCVVTHFLPPKFHTRPAMAPRIPGNFPSNPSWWLSIGQFQDQVDPQASLLPSNQIRLCISVLSEPYQYRRINW
jgi:hypothetical protein